LPKALIIGTLTVIIVYVFLQIVFLAFGNYQQM